MRIATILLITFILTGIILAGAGTYISNSDDIKFVEGEIINHLQTTAESRANHIETYLEQNVERLQMFTSKTILGDEIEEYQLDPTADLFNHMKKILLDQKKPMKDVERLCVVSLDGKVLVSTNPSFIGKDVSNEGFFINGKEEDVANFIEEDGRMKLFVTGPFVQDGKIVGVGLIVVKKDKLGEIVKDRTGLGETGEVLVAIQGEEKRIYLFDRLFESEAVSQDIEAELTSEPMKQALLGNEMFFGESLDYRDKEVIAVSQSIVLDSLDNNVLGLVAKIDREETFGAVEARFWRTSLILVISIVILTSLVGLFVARFISKPIKKLSENVKSVTQGNLDVQLSPSRITEVNDLTESINRALASMKLAILRTGVSKGQLGLGEAIKGKEMAEEKYQAIFESVTEGILGADPETKNFVFANPGICEITGYSEEELLKMSVKDIHPKKDLAYVQEEFKKQLKGDITIAKALPVLRKDKKIIYCDVISNVRVIEGKKIMLGVFREVTQELKVESQLRDVLDNIYDIIYEYNSKGKLIFIGGNLQKYGYNSKDNLQDKNIFDFICEEDKERVMRDVQNTLKTGKEFPTRFKLKCKDGTCVPVEEIGKVKKDVKGNIISVVGTIRDLSDDSKIADITNAILVYLNREGDVQVINQKGTEILGYKDEDEIVGKNWFENFVPEKTRAKVKTLANKMISGNVIINKYHENPVLTKSGKELNVAWHGEVIKNNNGDIIGHLSVGKVIDDAKDEVKEKRKKGNRGKSGGSAMKRLVGGVKERFALKKSVVNKSVMGKQVSNLPLKSKNPKSISKPVPVKKLVKQGAVFTKKTKKEKRKSEMESVKGGKKSFLKK